MIRVPCCINGPNVEFTETSQMFSHSAGVLGRVSRWNLNSASAKTEIATKLHRAKKTGARVTMELIYADNERRIVARSKTLRIGLE